MCHQFGIRAYQVVADKSTACLDPVRKRVALVMDTIQYAMNRIIRVLTMVLLLLVGTTTAHADLIFGSGFEAIPVTFDVEWSVDTQLIEGDAMAALISYDPETGEFQFSTAQLAQFGITLEPGDVLLVEGLAVARIVSVQDNGGTTIVGTSEATLADAIENGTIAWDVGIGFEQLSQATVTLDNTNVAASCVPEFNPGDSSVTFSCTSGAYTMTLKISSVNGRAEIQYQVVQKVNDNATASFTGTGTLDNFNSQGQIQYVDGALDSWSFDSDALSMQLRIELAAAGSGDSNINYELPVPMLKIPIPQLAILGVSIDIGAQIIVSLKVPAAAQASATASANYSYTGDTGFTYDGGDITTVATINGHDFTDGQIDSASQIGAEVDAQFGLAFPRIGLGILNQEVAWLHTGFIIGSSLTWGPICKSGYVRIVVEGGYEIKILGVSLASDKLTFAERERRFSQNDCAE